MFLCNLYTFKDGRVCTTCTCTIPAAGNFPLLRRSLLLHCVGDTAVFITWLMGYPQTRLFHSQEPRNHLGAVQACPRQHLHQGCITSWIKATAASEHLLAVPGQYQGILYNNNNNNQYLFSSNYELYNILKMTSTVDCFDLNQAQIAGYRLRSTYFLRYMDVPRSFITGQRSCAAPSGSPDMAIKPCLTRIASGESIWGSRSKKGRLLKNQWS